MEPYLQAIAAVTMAALSFIGGRMSRRKMAAEVTLAEVNAYEARIEGLVGNVENLRAEIILLRDEMHGLSRALDQEREHRELEKRVFEMRIAEMHQMYEEQALETARRHRQEIDRLQSNGGGGV